MLTAEQNALLTQTGANTPCGALLRSYWQPVALVDELDPERPVKAVRIFAEDLVLFRDERGRYGLLERDCPHRNADLAYGRREDGGLRCTFHGWLFDVEGRCVEMPAEPADSSFCDKVRQRAYPACERNGIVFGYLGAGVPPAFPAFDCFGASPAHSFAFKGWWECNWLQAVEVGIDPAHASYLHRYFADEDPAAGYGRQFRAATASALPVTRLLREYARPEIVVQPAAYGLALTALRRIDAEHMHVRKTNLIFPNAICVPMSAQMNLTQWHVPIDDHNSFWYTIFTSFGEPVDAAQMRRQRLELHTLPDYKPRTGKANRYGFQPAEQRTKTYTGMGDDINVHDQWAVESQGRIQDRTREHLGQSDKAITAYRRALFAALKTPPPALDERAAASLGGPGTIDGIGPAADWEAHWQRAIDERAANAPWARRRVAEPLH
jgi:phenylpropionate dioxygenase-like ring-hydroxylating dioxygenase large terminal subunit